MQSQETLYGPHAALAEFVITKVDETLRVQHPERATDPPKTWPILKRAKHYSTRFPLTGFIWADGECCWHDCHPITAAEPVFLPVAHDEVQDIFWVYGRFCSFRCAMKFVYTHQVTCAQHTIMLLQLLAHKIYNWPVGLRITAAPARESLRLFGNTGRSAISLVQFRSQHTATTNYRKPPMLQTTNLNPESEHILLYKAFGDSEPYIMLSNFRSRGTDLTPKTTGTHADSVCWHDTHELPDDVNIVGIPISLTDGVYTVYGVFCSYECALSYLMEHKDWNTDEQIVLLHHLANTKKICGQTTIVKPAPPAWDLYKFGGDLGIDEFRETYCLTTSCGDEPVVWATTSVEYQTMSLPSSGSYESLRNIGIMSTSTAAATETSSNQAPIEDLVATYLNMTQNRIAADELDLSSVDVMMAASKKKPNTPRASAAAMRKH